MTPRATVADTLRALAPVLVALADAIGIEEPEPDATPADSWVDARSCAPLSRRRFLALCASGAIPSSAVGRRVVARRSALDAYLASRERTPKPTPRDACTQLDAWLAERGVRRASKGAA